MYFTMEGLAEGDGDRSRSSYEASCGFKRASAPRAVLFRPSFVWSGWSASFRRRFGAVLVHSFSRVYSCIDHVQARLLACLLACSFA